MIVAYARDTTLDEELQIGQLSELGIEKWFIDRVEREDTELKKALDFVNDGDSLYVYDFLSIASSVTDLINIINLLINNGIHFVSIKDNIDTSKAECKLLIPLLTSINIFENNFNKPKGHKGRKEIKISNFNKYYDRYMHRELNKSQLAKQLKISRNTLDRLIKKHQNSIKTIVKIE